MVWLTFYAHQVVISSRVQFRCSYCSSLFFFSRSRSFALSPFQYSNRNRIFRLIERLTGNRMRIVGFDLRPPISDYAEVDKYESSPLFRWLPVRYDTKASHLNMYAIARDVECVGACMRQTHFRLATTTSYLNYAENETITA